VNTPHHTPKYQLTSSRAIFVNPTEALVYGLLVSTANELLHNINLVTFAVDFVPPIEAFIVEVLAHLCADTT